MRRALHSIPCFSSRQWPGAAGPSGLLAGVPPLLHCSTLEILVFPVSPDFHVQPPHGNLPASADLADLGFDRPIDGGGAEQHFLDRIPLEQALELLDRAVDG